jgi:cell division protein FtsB
MTDSWKEKFVKWFTLALVAAVLVGGLLVAWPTYRRCLDLRRADADLSDRIEAKRAEIAKLLDNQRRFKTDPDFVEHIARQNHRLFPGELVFLFNEDK